MGKVIGVDLGTGFSAASYTVGKQTQILVNAEGHRLTPSVVAFLEDGTRLVGRAAKNQAVINPQNTLSSVKRLMGRRRSEISPEEEKLISYKLVGEPDDLVQIEVLGKRYYPPQISAMILQDLKKTAERALGGSVTECVVTIPAYFGDAARNATREACEISGMRAIRLVSEPTAAAVAYGLDKSENQRIVVIDVGTGTADVTALEFAENCFQVISTSGDLFLGGDNVDFAIMEYVAEEFKKSSGIDVRLDPLAKQRLLDACEKCKCELSTMLQSAINIPYVASAGGVPKHLNISLTRSKFEQICAPVFERLKKPIHQAMQDSKLNCSQIQKVVLVGGSCRIPRIVQICKEIFNQDPYLGMNPDEAVACGASVAASMLSGETTDLVLIDVTPLTLGLETLGGLCTPVIPRNSAIPTSKTETFSTASDNQPAVDIHVLQGERRMASGNRTLGRFQMTEIPLQLRGKPAIDVLFDIDANGILTVSASDKHTGKSHRVEIKGSSGLDKSDIDRMVKDAAAYEVEDKNRADLIESRNRADGLLYGTETFMRENSKFISAGCHAGVKAAVDALRGVLDAQGSKIQIESAMDALEVANKKMHDECFAGAAQKGQAAPASKPMVAPEGEIIEAQFEVK